MLENRQDKGVDSFDICRIHLDFFEAEQEANHIFRGEVINFLGNGGHKAIELLSLLSLMGIDSS